MWLALGSCEGGSSGPSDEVEYTEQREVCADRNAYRNLYWGDLHAHTGLSFDAWSYGTVASPSDLYNFAKGQELAIGPLDERNRRLQLDRPLDFAAVTDHHEYLAEVTLCVDENSPVGDSETCANYRLGNMGNVVAFGLRLTDPNSLEPFEDICDPEQVNCNDVAIEVWNHIQDAAEEHYDRSGNCSFTTFVGYEYTNATNVSNLHRNVIFRNATIPLFPPSFFEQPTPEGLFRELAETCLDADSGCDCISIPHNSNWSNGQLFYPDYGEAESRDEERQLAKMRARLEPLAEIFQHKGDMECETNFAELDGPEDPLCNYEKQRHPPLDECGEEPGVMGVSLMGCIHKLEFLRNVFKTGLKEKQRLGVNPFRLGVIGSTDTHNATPGYVEEEHFEGHVGSTDDTPALRLGPGNMTHHGVRYNPGGLAAVWSVENSRDALFEAFRRREVYGTSGPRIKLRFFGGWGLSSDLCEDDESRRLEAGYGEGVPMGGQLTPEDDSAPTFVAWAEADGERPLQRMQIIKGWLDAQGQSHEKVYEMAGDPDNGAEVDLATCETSGSGEQVLCGSWTDPDFDPSLPAFYYIRVLENPTCRWSVRQCNALPAEDRPESCDDPNFYRSIQERAWSTPIWLDPR